MDNEIRQVPQSPVLVNNDSGHNRDSWKTAPSSPKEDFKVMIDAITEERENSTSYTGSSSESPNTSRQDYSEKFDHVEHNSDIDGIDWRPGFKHQFPWLGFAGLMVILVATAGAVIILATSNEKRVKDWPFTKFTAQPNVLLNIANQVQNLGLVTLIGQGLAIAWWRTALRGSSLRKLHQNHAYSYSFYAIITSGRHFNIIALAALMTKFAVIDSTLFQKATKTIVTQESDYMNHTMTGFIEKDWPANSGGIPGGDGNIKTVDKAWANVLDAYNGKIANGKVHDTLDQTKSFWDCPFRQECHGAIEGLGFSFNCTSTSRQVDYGYERRESDLQGIPPSDNSYALWDVKFNASWPTGTKPYASIDLEMLYVDSKAGEDEHSCPGTMTIRRCEIKPALVQYPVTVMVPSEEELKGKNIVTHIKFSNDSRPDNWEVGESLDNITQIDQLEVKETINLEEQFGKPSTIGALTYIMNNLYASSANLTYNNDTWDIVARGASAQTTFYAQSDETLNRCWYNISQGKDDPAVEVLRKLNTLSFVTALYITGAPFSSKSLDGDLGMANQTIIASVTGIVEQYKTSYAYVAGALVATFVTVMLVLPVYWGFWQLGRKVTLGPLEISQAFGAPIIAPDQTKAYHGDFDQVLEDVGKRRVQYGQLKHAPPGQMGLAEPERVVVPKASHRWRVSGQRENRRIGLGAAIGGVVAATIAGNAKG
ncbi:hypothetical protein CC77DRAFT_1021035 [Alternaria alternata]|uniref:Uncharacterized protein n=1 Tax=Alternaria alternata TaxID=5599 RepID=A0A177DKT6_ALTAL|nr:hypothetical protein CC77DRAFT_1021035 [Alternaria alternata]OAG19642.1 hypothetical protein CC77DRAFT_1021035 [Alternaria alternata]